MKPKSNTNGGRYLYAVVAGEQEREYGAIGVAGGSVYSVSDGKVAAVVSDVPQERLRPERRHLAAHQMVLKQLMTESTPLPMAFGIIADGSRAIRNILSKNQKAFLVELEHVRDKVEMGLRVIWDVPNIFEYFVQSHPELRAVRDRCFGTSHEPSKEDMIEVGRTFERLLNEDRQEYLETVLDILSPLCCEVKDPPARNEREVLNLACLIGRDTQEEFEAGVFKTAQLFDNNFAFDYNGPWAPYNFVGISVGR